MAGGPAGIAVVLHRAAEDVLPLRPVSLLPWGLWGLLCCPHVMTLVYPIPTRCCAYSMARVQPMPWGTMGHYPWHSLIPSTSATPSKVAARISL